MIKKLLIVICIILLSFSGCSKIENTQNNNATNAAIESEYISEDNGIRYKNNSIVILFKVGITKEEINQVIEDISGEIMSKDLANLYIYEIKVKKSSLDELKVLCEELKKDPLVDDAYPEYISEIGLD